MTNCSKGPNREKNIENVIVSKEEYDTLIDKLKKQERETDSYKKSMKMQRGELRNLKMKSRN